MVLVWQARPFSVFFKTSVFFMIVVGEPFMAGGQGPNSNLGDQFNRGSGGPIGNMPMGQRQQYPYGTGYERR